MPGVLIVAIDVAQMPRPRARSAVVPARHHPTAFVLAIIVRVIGQVVVTAAIAIDPMTVMVTAFMPVAIPVALAPIFPRVAMLDAIVFAACFILTAELVGDALVSLIAGFSPILPPFVADLIPEVLPIVAGLVANVLPILDAGLMLVPGRLTIRLILMTLLLTRFGMRLI